MSLFYVGEGLEIGIVLWFVLCWWVYVCVLGNVCRWISVIDVDGYMDVCVGSVWIRLMFRMMGGVLIRGICVCVSRM